MSQTVPVVGRYVQEFFFSLVASEVFGFNFKGARLVV